MKFRTEIPISKSKFPIDYNSKIVSFGSCFAENMAEKLSYFKFQNTCNPFGILFHPLAIEKIISKAVNLEFFTKKDIFFHDERWHCFDVHSDLSNSNEAELVANLNKIIELTHQKIAESTHFIITYGTSWVYNNVDNNTIVANCHKVPQKQFSKEILSVATIEKSIQNTIGFIQKLNPNCKIIFTISPVRHIKDGFVENQRSKAHLITAIQNLQLEYFPSYEILMDELRDYRFYAEDMLHPSQLAIDYIWDRFFETAISEESHTIMDEVESIQKGLAHRPFNPDSEKHKKFLSNLKQKMNTLALKFPKIQF
ncbi:GSCFA domain-containing protein [Flavobacterium sp.]|uniref:GSCFA domain-containing protein n=1 Tax=Flavobacterium sp. TaxID=239 RepID=UPI0037B5AF0D